MRAALWSLHTCVPRTNTNQPFHSTCFLVFVFNVLPSQEHCIPFPQEPPELLPRSDISPEWLPHLFKPPRYSFIQFLSFAKVLRSTSGEACCELLAIHSKVQILDDEKCPEIYLAQLPSQEDGKLPLCLLGINTRASCHTNYGRQNNAPSEMSTS